MDRKIELSATGSLSLIPDAVTVCFSVNEFGEEYKYVQKSLNQRVIGFRALVEGVGFKQKDLVSEHYEIQQSYEYDKNDNKHPSGFQGEHRLSIKFELDQELLDKLLRTLHPALIGIPYKVSFGFLNREAYKNQVIDIAVKKAIAEAEQLVKSAGVKLGSIIQMNYGERNYPRLAMYDSESDSIEDTMDDYINPGFEPGELSISQTVHIEWELID